MIEDMVYVLLSVKSGLIRGIFKDTILLYSTYKTIKELLPSELLKVQQVIINTNIVKKVYTEPELDELIGLESNAVSEVFPKEIKREVDKIKQKLCIFKENMKTFEKLIADNIIDLDEEDRENIPILFRDKFDIFRDIIKLKIPEDEMFSYFVDRFEFQDIDL